MPMTTAPTGQTPLGEQLYFFESGNSLSQSCLILAHGGYLPASGMYTLPANVSIHFYVAHGESWNTNPFHAICNPAGQSASYHAPAGSQIENYTLMKALGVDSAGSPANYIKAREYVEMNQGLGGSWNPHLVSIRRRNVSIGKSIKLGEVIDLVTAHKPCITDFFYGACRNDYTGSPKGALAMFAVKTGIKGGIMRAKRLITGSSDLG